MDQVILYASLPLPVSVNSMYFTDASGIRRITRDAKNWKALMFDYLDAGQAELPEVVYLNAPLIQTMRDLYGKKKNVTTERQKGFFRLDILFVFPTMSSDIDGCTKLTMDTIFDWLRGKRDGDKGMLFDDNRVFSLPVQKVVTKEVLPHVEFGLREYMPTQKSGDLIAHYRQLSKTIA